MAEPAPKLDLGWVARREAEAAFHKVNLCAIECVLWLASRTAAGRELLAVTNLVKNTRKEFISLCNI